MMKRTTAIVMFMVATASSAAAGGFYVPGQGPVSTGRAGAAVASTQDGEAIAINPAGLAATTGTVVQIGIVGLDYSMSFTRSGTYDAISDEAATYAGQPYPTVTNNSKPRFGIGSHQPIPTIAVATDLGGKIPGLRAGFAIYAPQSYPFRNMNTVNGKPYFSVDPDGRYNFPNIGDPPPPTRYDVIYQSAEVVLSSLAVAYRVLPSLDLGARVSNGMTTIRASAGLWGVANFEEWIKRDGLLTLDAKDNFSFTYGFGAMYRPTPQIEVGANFNAPINIHAQGDALAAVGPEVKVAGMNVSIGPIDDDLAKCGKGGTAEKLKGCVDITLPMSLQVGGRYKFHDRSGKLKADVELGFDWQHWGAKCDYAKDPLCHNPSDYRLIVDGVASLAGDSRLGVPLAEVFLRHGLRDSYAARLGGSYIVRLADNELVIRGGVGHETAVAKPGWERLEFDGAAQTTLAAGASYKLATWSFDAGFGAVLEGSRMTNRDCNPAEGNLGCSGTGQETPVDKRQGPDPVNPSISANQQAESPVNQGRIRSHYLMWMVGASHRF